MTRLWWCQALAREKERRRNEGAPHNVLAEVERDSGVLFLEYVSLEMQSGHTEQAVVCMQALLEFTFFAPSFEGALNSNLCIFTC